MCSALSLHSPEEYHFWLMTYVRYLVQAGMFVLSVLLLLNLKTQILIYLPHFKFDRFLIHALILINK